MGFWDTFLSQVWVIIKPTNGFVFSLRDMQSIRNIFYSVSSSSPLVLFSRKSSETFLDFFSVSLLPWFLCWSKILCNIEICPLLTPATSNIYFLRRDCVKLKLRYSQIWELMKYLSWGYEKKMNLMRPWEVWRSLKEIICLLQTSWTISKSGKKDYRKADCLLSVVCSALDKHLRRCLGKTDKHILSLTVIAKCTAMTPIICAE